MGNQRLVSKKCEYALRAIFELVRREGDEPVKIQEIASVQDIPIRFLEVILVELKHGGFVSSRRGKSGGYVLTREPDDIVVGEVIGFFKRGGSGDVKGRESSGQRFGDLTFARLWKRAEEAISQVYDQITFQDLLEEEIAAGYPEGANYVI